MPRQTRQDGGGIPFVRGEGAADGIALDGGDDDPHVLRIFAGSARGLHDEGALGRRIAGFEQSCEFRPAAAGLGDGGFHLLVVRPGVEYQQITW